MVLKGYWYVNNKIEGKKSIFCVSHFGYVMHCLDLIFTGYDFGPTQKKSTFHFVNGREH